MEVRSAATPWSAVVACVGYGLLLASAPMSSATEVIFSADVLGEGQIGWYDQIAFTLSFALGVALLASQARYIPSMLSHGFLIPGGLALTVAGTLFYLVRLILPEASYLTPLGSMIRGFGHSILMMGWFEAIIDANRRVSLVLSLSLITAALAGGAVWLLASMEGHAAAFALLLLMPVASTGLLYRSYAQIRKSDRHRLAHTQDIDMPRSTKGIVAAFGLALGCTWAAFYSIEDAHLSLWAAAAFLAMGTFMLVGINSFMPKRELEFGSALRWCMLFTSFGFLTLPLLAERIPAVAAILLATAWSAQILLLAFLPIQMASKLPVSMLSVASLLGLKEAPENELYASRMERRVSALSEKRNLTAREREIALLLVLGKTRGQISEALLISEQTVKTHIRHIYEKLDVHSLRELVILVEDGAR